MLAVSIIDQHHGELELLGIVHGLQPEDACSGLLASAYDIGNQMPVFGMDHVHQVASVIDDDVRTRFNDLADTVHVFLFRSPVDSKDIEPLVDECGRDIILGGKRVASGDEHLRTAFCQNFTKMSGLGLQMH